MGEANVEAICAPINNATGTDDAFVTGQKQLLRHSVNESLQNYFGKLGDGLVDNLYTLVLAEVEEPLLKAVLDYTRGNQSRAAVLLGLSRGTLRKKLKLYGFIK